MNDHFYLKTNFYPKKRYMKRCTIRYFRKGTSEKVLQKRYFGKGTSEKVLRKGTQKGTQKGTLEKVLWKFSKRP